MNEQEALAQFIKPDKTRCNKCLNKLVDKSGRYMDCDSNGVSIEVCETCFDNDIKKRQGFYH